ncbi:hypothetical protein EBB59_09050 [Lysobacter pythonis]|uniref:Uncharacterized protein n=1 Tax=Solilutibacter pythonis TaxID=2483112 RepID=A0A3M2HRF2_9GAMM|nr:hypothetical protein [Lysobacter pythonis]RMH90915.1 hypothetical protein EBB59_09050 [Lysobacter pythonis]
MPVNFTKAQASKLLTVSEMKLHEESRIAMLRKFSASQLDRRIERTRALRDKARDQLQRQRVAQREKTGSKRGLSGTANQQRSKDKIALIADILKRFEGQLKIARKNEKAGIVPTRAPARRATRKAAIAKAKAPNKDFTASRMRAKNRAEEEAGSAMKARKTAKKTARKAAGETAAKPTAKKTARKTVAKKSPAAKTPVAKKATAKKASPAPRTSAKTVAKKTAAKRPANTPVGGKTGGKRTASVKALSEAGQNVRGGFPNPRAHDTAQQRAFQEARSRPIQAHISSQDRRQQAKRDGRG